MSDKSRRFRLRAALTGAAALIAVTGLAQAVPTMAAGADAVVATSGNLTAAANVLPAATTYGCDAVKNGTHLAVTNWNTQMKVTHVNKAFDYRVYYIQDNNTIVKTLDKSADNVALGTVLYFDQVGGVEIGRHTGWNFTARIYSVNRISGEMSLQWVGEKIYQPTVYQTNCNGATSGTGHPVGVVAARMASPVEDGATTVESVIPTPTPSESDTSTPTSPNASTTPLATTTPETHTPETTTPETTTPEATPTEEPKLVLTDTLESGGLTAGWTVGGNKVAVVDADGKELASGRAEAGSTLHWYDGQLWIVGTTEVYRIMESPQDGKWKFYTDSGQNMPDFG